jgi:hypothetical protein
MKTIKKKIFIFNCKHFMIQVDIFDRKCDHSLSFWSNCVYLHKKSKLKYFGHLLLLLLLSLPLPLHFLCQIVLFLLILIFLIKKNPFDFKLKKISILTDFFFSKNEDTSILKEIKLTKIAKCQKVFVKEKLPKV